MWRLLLICFGGVAATWTQLTPGATVPTQRYYHSAASDGDVLYVFGGLTFDNSYIPHNDLWALVGGSWRQLSPGGDLPGPRGYASLTPIGNGQLLLFGGKTEPPNEYYYNDTYIYNTKTNTWSAQISPVVPEARFYHSAALVGDSVWVFGGASRSIEIVTNDVWATKTGTISWTEVKQNGTGGPAGRQGHSAVPWNNGMVIFGGRSGVDKGGFNDVWFFDGSSWTNLSPSGPIIPGRAAHSASLLSGKMYIFGGIYVDPSPPFQDHYHNDLWALDLTGKVWTQLQGDSQNADPSRPWQRQGHTGNTVGTSLVIFGGYGNFQGLQNDLWAWK